MPQYRFLSIRRGDYRGPESSAGLAKMMEENFRSAKTDKERYHAKDQLSEALACRCFGGKLAVGLYEVLGFHVDASALESASKRIAEWDAKFPNP
jgi:hypothetical protein